MSWHCRGAVTPGMIEEGIRPATPWAGEIRPLLLVRGPGLPAGVRDELDDGVGNDAQVAGVGDVERAVEGDEADVGQAPGELLTADEGDDPVAGVVHHQ